MIKRVTLLMLTLAMLLTSLTSCGIIILRDPDKDGETAGADTTEASPDTADSDTGDSGSDTSDVTTVTETTRTPSKPVETTDYRPISEDLLAKLPEWDFDGIAVSIVTSDPENFSPSDTDDVVYNARIERNRMVEQKYNTMVMVTAADVTTIHTELKAAVKAGDYYADIVAIPQNYIGRFQAEGLLMNLRSLPFTDFSAPYYNSDAMTQLTAGHAIYGAVGAFNENLDYLYGLFFNRDMAKKLGYDPYDLVYGGNWDFDTFRRMAKDAAALGSGTKGHGASVDINTYESILFAASGVDFFDCAWGKVPTLDYASDRVAADATDNAVRAIRALFGDGSEFTDSNGSYTFDGAFDAFYAGELLFYTDRIYFTSWIADMKDNWGMLPFPDLGNGYHTFADTSFPVVCVPYGSSNVELTGLFLEAANAASYGWLDDVYYENLQMNIVRDGDTLNMLDIICGRRSGEVLFSFAYMFGSQYSEVANATYGALYSAIGENYSMSSYQEAHEAAVKRKLDRAFVMIQ